MYVCVMCEFACVPRGVRLILGVCRARAHTFARSLSRKLIGCLILGRRAYISTHACAAQINLDIALAGKLFRSSGLAKGEHRSACRWLSECVCTIFYYLLSSLLSCALASASNGEIHSLAINYFQVRVL
jgi:hypothetical protein